MNKKENKKPKQNLIFKIIMILGVGISLFLLLKPIYEARVVERKDLEDKIAQFEESINYDNEKDVVKTLSKIDLSLAQSEMIGVIYIPKIDLSLPIYYGIDESSISEGAGTMTEYGLPYGEVGIHSVVTSHSGLSSSGLFTSINKLEKSDVFYIKNINGTIQKYFVFDVVTILPTDFSKFDTIEDKSVVTLLTCTPIGINTHRLLVQGFKVKDFESMDEAKKEIVANTQFTLSDYEITVIFIISIAIIILILIKLISIYYKLRKEIKENEKKINKNI